MTIAPEARIYRSALQLVDSAADTSPAGGGWLYGRAVPYDTDTDVGFYIEQMAPGVFAKSIAESARALPLLLWHDNQTWPIGAAHTWDDTDTGLDAVWRLSDDDQARRARQLADTGMLTGLSVGFVPVRSEWTMVSDEEWNPDLGIKDTVRRIEGRLVEVSLTPTPAYAEAGVTLVRTAERRQRGAVERPRLAAWRQLRAGL
jgi:HK97 family phage prohead protease